MKLVGNLDHPMDLPDYLLEKVFCYLSWSDRASAARVCRKWCAVFHAPSLWRRITFTPPDRPLSRLQYDMKGYRTACCLRTIGSYINEYRFLKSEDIFLLNRILSLIANYLESNPNLSDPGPGSDFSDTRSSGTELDNDDPMLLGNQEFIPPGSVEPCEPINALGQSDDEQVFLSGYCGSIIGDPDAEATLKLIMKLQKRETFNISSSDSEESDLDTREFLNEMRSISVSLPENTPVPIVRSTGRVYQRSQSCRYAQSTNAPRNPPLIRVFELDFHCEVDGMRGFVYGTGGALLSTIRRVVRQLNSVQRLYLTDLFLNAFDARNLILDIHKTSSRCLLDLNLVHLSKPSTDPQLRSPGALTNTSVTCHQDCCWYFLDSRWLEARPHQSHTNPLADLCYLFPHLRRLTLAPTQISGPMLLRLLYQTTLQELILVEVCWRLSPARSRSSHASDMFLHATFCSITDFTPFAMHQEARESYAYDLQHWQPDVDDALIDWSDDVPHYKDRLGSAAFQATLLTGWPLISPAAWRAASILRPHLSVELRCYFSRPLTAITAPDTWIPCLLSMWPHPPCPLSTVVVQSTTKYPFIGSFLSLKNTMNVSIYSTTLTTLILYIRPEATDEPNHHPITIEVNAIDECGEVNAFLRDAPALLPSLNFIGIGGSYSFLCLTTLLSLCRHLGRRSSSHTDVSSQHFKLLIDESCCRFDDPISNDAPATVIAWHSAILATGNNMTRRKAATQQCISAALAQLKWCFLNTAQFQSEMMHYLVRHSSATT